MIHMQQNCYEVPNIAMVEEILILLYVIYILMNKSQGMDVWVKVPSYVNKSEDLNIVTVGCEKSYEQ